MTSEALFIDKNVFLLHLEKIFVTGTEECYFNKRTDIYQNNHGRMF